MGNQAYEAHRSLLGDVQPLGGGSLVEEKLPGDVHSLELLDDVGNRHVRRVDNGQVMVDQDVEQSHPGRDLEGGQSVQVDDVLPLGAEVKTQGVVVDRPQVRRRQHLRVKAHLHDVLHGITIEEVLVEIGL